MHRLGVILPLIKKEGNESCIKDISHHGKQINYSKSYEWIENSPPK
jgi:hypothetical protein